MAVVGAQDEDSSDQPPSQVLTVLTQGRKDLWNAEPPRFIGFVCYPLRNFVLDPSFAIASIVLPPMTSAIPGADPVVAKLIGGLWFFPLGLVYRIPPPSFSDDLRLNARNDIIINAKAGVHVPKYRPPSDLSSAIQGAIAFTISVTADLVGAFMDRKKMTKWFEAMTEFKAYLDISGVGDEMEEAMMKPMLRGRLLDNIKILNDIQEIMYADRSKEMKKYSDEEIEGPLREGKRMMRFATAAYGTEMIRSALDRDAGPEELENQKKAIAFHSDVPVDDIRIIYVEDGGDMKVLRHFVAVDRRTKSVVLALRGTLSISGALVDMQAMDCDFCCGKAHKGIAEMANGVWMQSGAKIAELFETDEELKDYKFVITGHSLGAGAACLLNIKCHLEKLLGDRPVKCYGFAPPPTYHDCGNITTMEPDRASAFEAAIENCLCYIHDNDCVPHLSVQSIRRLVNLMDAVDNQTEHMWAWKRFKLFWEWEPIPQELIDSVTRVETSGEGIAQRECSGASKLIIPARMVIWMKKNYTGASFEGIGCDPRAVADMNIFCNQDMISDHMPEQYEDALDALCHDTQVER